jgi:hypothetical protein
VILIDVRQEVSQDKLKVEPLPPENERPPEIDLNLLLRTSAAKSSSSRTDLHDDVVDVTSLSALDVVEHNIIC